MYICFVFFFQAASIKNVVEFGEGRSMHVIPINDDGDLGGSHRVVQICENNVSMTCTIQFVEEW